MPTLIVEDLPGEIYERIERQAKARNQTISEEVVRLLRQGLRGPEPKTTEPVAAPPIAVEPRLPTSIILDTGEMSAPCSLPRSGPGVEVHAEPGGERQPTSFTFVEEAESNNV